MQQRLQAAALSCEPAQKLVSSTSPRATEKVHLEALVLPSRKTGWTQRSSAESDPWRSSSAPHDQVAGARPSWTSTELLPLISGPSFDRCKCLFNWTT